MTGPDSGASTAGETPAGPRHPRALYRAGIAAALEGDPATAATLFQAAIAAGGGTAECHYNLGQALHRAGDPAGAERAYWAAILRAPGFADAYNSLGVTLAGCGRADDAAAAFQRAITERPGYAEARHNLASVLLGAGQADAAFALYRDWLATDPGNQHLIFLTGTAALNADSLPEAETYLRQALLRQPRDAGVWNNLALALVRMGRVGEAVAAFAKAVEIRPDYAEALFGLASAHQAAGQAALALDTYEKTRALLPDAGAIDSNLLMALNYSDTLTAGEVYGRHRRWGDAYLRERGGVPPAPVPAVPLTGQRLRIGYVSPDFRLHSVAMFLLPLLEHHDRNRVELFAYSNVERADVVTGIVRRQVDHWRVVAGMDADAAANMIRGDGIDLLVDLAGHTARNRLDVFARRPAPVQATWLGYPATTGLATVDVRFTDAAADPPGDADRRHVERLERLEHFLCYRPLGPTPDPLPPPGAGAGNRQLRVVQRTEQAERCHRGVVVAGAARGPRQPAGAEGGGAGRPGGEGAGADAVRRPWHRRRAHRPAATHPQPFRPSGCLWRHRHRPGPDPLQRDHDDVRGAVDGGAGADSARRGPCRTGGRQPADRCRAAGMDRRRCRWLCRQGRRPRRRSAGARRYPCRPARASASVLSVRRADLRPPVRGSVLHAFQRSSAGRRVLAPWLRPLERNARQGRCGPGAFSHAATPPQAPRCSKGLWGCLCPPPTPGHVERPICGREEHSRIREKPPQYCGVDFLKFIFSNRLIAKKRMARALL
ncbi:tetratricopeptide (TPR) repeat protein [Azospirillum fermentarium]|nr:tetratricopeptide repeat protein [Azospirillum fermentarium]MCW2249047.1 tetratricopeptide (TPR) repeat protein [Azospirillum fermentarium]